MSLTVLEAYGLIEFQGPPQYGLRRFGVPIGGWFDRESAMAANVLAGRPPNSFCLELTLASIGFKSFLPFMFSVAGSPVEIRIDGQITGEGGLFLAPAGSEVSISPPRTGARAYLSAAFIGARSATNRIKSGDSLPVAEPLEEPRTLRLAESESCSNAPLRIVHGPQATLFDTSRLAKQAFTVSRLSNRVGIRLSESALPHGVDVPSEPAGFGAVQITPQGSPIILGPDGPTIGGYPKIAYVVSADLDNLAQLRPDQTISFEWVSIEIARELALKHSQRAKQRFAELSLAVEAPSQFT